MFVVEEVFRADGKRFPMYWHKDQFTAEVWAINHRCDMVSVQAGRAELIVEREDG